MQARRLIDVVQFPGGMLDAFYRLRTSAQFTQFSSKQITNDFQIQWDDQEVSGSGTASTYNTGDASTTLSVGAVAGRRVRQSKVRLDYQSGRGQKIVLTGVMGNPVAGVTKRIGSFDDDNGVFFEMTGDGLGVVIRNGGVDNRIEQDDWNVDKLRGKGTSAYTILPEFSQIYFIDFEWLGVGQVRYGIFREGQPVICHAEDNVNRLPGVYMANPNLPVRYEIINDGAGAADELKVICSAVETEGGADDSGISRSVDRGIVPYVTGVNQSLHPVLSLRLKSTHQHVTVIPESANFISVSKSDFRWALLLNPTIAGTDNASWISLPVSGIEYDISRNNTNTLTGGYQFASGYVGDGNDVIGLSFPPQTNLGASIAGVSDEYVIAVQNIAGSQSETYFGSFQFREK